METSQTPAGPSASDASSPSVDPGQSKAATKTFGLVALILTLLVTLALFLPITHYQFSIIDDDANVYNNFHLKNPQAQDIGYFWRTPYYELYMPVTSTIWALLIRVATVSKPLVVPPGGGYTSTIDPSVFHVASLIFHLAVTTLVFVILRRLRFGACASAAGALVFAIHPIQIQAVAWITGLNNLTGGFFGLLALFVYSLQIAGSNTPADRAASSRSWLRPVCLTASTVLFIAGLLSKPTTIVIPIFLAIFEVLIWRRPWRTWGGLLGFWMVLSIVCGLITRSASAEATAFVWSPLWGRPFVVGDALAFYLAKMAWPIHLTFDYTRSPHSVLTNWWGYVTWVVPVVVAGLLWRGSRSKENIGSGFQPAPESPVWIRVAILIFVAGLLPTLGIVPNYSQVVSSVFDRYLYLSLFGLAILVAHVVSRFGGRTRIGPLAVGLLLVYFGVETYLQVPVWTDMKTQTDQLLVANPNSAIGHHDKGMILGAQDDLPGALAHFQTEVDLQHGTNARGDFYLGVTLVELNRYAEAVKPLKYAFKAAKDDGEYWYQYWNVLVLLNRLDEAEAVVREHINVNPDDGRAELTLGKMLVARGDANAALPYLDKAATLLPKEPAVAFFTGLAQEKLGRRPEAIAAYQRAAELDPSRQEISDALRRLRGP